jgi:DNA-binding response OmpR family regulator
VHLGSGLGLAYTKHLVEIHGGEIDIQSELHKGTTCSITIPITREAYDTNAVVEMRPESHKFQFTQREIEDSKAMYIAGNKATGLIKHNEETPTILVVEDNEELNEYLVGYFNQEYNVIRAFDGKSGLDMVRNKLPDIIISDLMMPKLGGIEMCKMVKTDLKTSHIPVIILTAKAGIENEKEGLETGAEEFVLKPFNIELLKLRVDNILRNKSQWIEKFKSDDSTETWKELSNKLDKEFLEKGIAIVKSNIDNSEFTVAQFAMDMGMSRSSLFSKLKSITNQSTSEFIRNIRLKKAATLIKTGRYSITEVVFLTGFSDPKYFRTCFKKLYDKTPSEYLNDFKVKS